MTLTLMAVGLLALLPVRSEPGVFGSMRDPAYDAAIADLMVPDLYRHAQTIVELPKGLVEAVYLVREEPLRSGSECHIVKARLKTPLLVRRRGDGLYPTNAYSGIATKTVRLLPPSFCDRLEALWTSILAKTEPEPPPGETIVVRQRSTVYHIATFERGTGYRAAVVEPPDKNADFARLVSALSAYAETGQESTLGTISELLELLNNAL